MCSAVVLFTKNSLPEESRTEGAVFLGVLVALFLARVLPGILDAQAPASWSAATVRSVSGFLSA